MTSPSELQAYRRALLNQARECDEREESSGMRRARTFWRLEAARLRQVAHDADLLAKELGGEGGAA